MLSNPRILMASSGASGGYTILNSVYGDGSTGYFSRTLGTPTNDKVFTFSFWLKRTYNLANATNILSAGTGIGANSRGYIGWDSNYIFTIDPKRDGGGGSAVSTTVEFLRDSAAHGHYLIVVDSTQATAANRVKFYHNNTQITLSGTFITQNASTVLNSAIAHDILRLGWGLNTQYSPDYVSEMILVDGQALTPSSFGETDGATGSWKPKAYSGTYGTNGFKLDFAVSGDLGNDVSGNNNDWTKTGTVTQTTDTPTDKVASNIGNYYTYNPTAAMSGLTFGSGNLNISSVTAGAWRRWCFTGTPLTSGKWYWEIKATTASDKSLSIGVQGLSDGFRFDTNDVIGSSSGSATGWSFQLSGTKWNNGSSGAYGSFTSGDTIMIAYDADNQKIWWGSNGTWFSSGDPAAGTNAAFSSVTATGGLIPACSCATADFSEIRLNSGQTAFAYTPPTGFSRLSTANLPAPTIKNDDLHFNVVTYTGTGASLSITGVGFQPDFVWIKSRSAATDHALYDAVRGVQKRLETNNSDAEVTSDGGITSFDSDGFTLGTLAQVNTNTATYVAWCWKGNGSGSSNTSGSITSTVSANTTAGISIVTYTGNATAGATVGHGLGAAPKFMIFKSRSSTGFGRTFHTSLGATKYIDLTTDAAVTSATAWNDTAPSSTVFTLGTGTPNDNTVTQVAYCFVEVSGFSKFGTYTGNGAADGPFVWCGFRPKFVLLKIASGGTGHWLIYDTARSTYNLVQANLGASAATADEVTSNMLDIVSNGFKFRTADGTSNLSGGTFIFAAFAEYPFGGTGTTQGKAR